MATKRFLYFLAVIIIFGGLALALNYIDNNMINNNAEKFNPENEKKFASKINTDNAVLIGTHSNGLFISYDNGKNFKKILSPAFLNSRGKHVPITKILPLNKDEYIFVTLGNGLVYTKDGGRTFTPLNNGLPLKKIVVNGKLAENIYRDITAITHDTVNKNNLVVTTKYGIYFSYNRGKNWEFYSKPPRFNNNLTAAAFSTKYGFHLYLGTAYNGLFAKESKNGKWIRLNRGLKMTGSIVEEIGSLAIDPKDHISVYCGHNFGNRLYKLDKSKIKWQRDETGSKISYSLRSSRWKNVKLPFPEKRGTVEVLNDIQDVQIRYDDKIRKLILVSNHGIVHINSLTKKWQQLNVNVFLSNLSSVQDVNTFTVFSGGKLSYSFNNVHLLKSRWKFSKKSRYYEKAKAKRGFYIQTHVAFQKERLNRLIKYLKKCNYNMVTIDLKDDFGMVNYHSSLDIVKKVGSDKGTKINLKRFVKKMHEHGIYVVARMVIFKDPVLFKYKDGKYSVYNSKKEKPWRAEFYRGKKVLRNKERWTDPFAPFVWKYNVAIAKEMESMGVDEIQFDYIRFPTDGDNMEDIKFRHKKNGQQQKDAIESFLYLARTRLKSPISVDIYGANGWYHMGDRIGQDIEMLAQYTDVICPMFYPSHFENSFLNFKPYKERPYRIYYYGTRRSLIMARYHVDIRSWLQAFKIKSNPYDKKYYGTKYVAYSILGVRHADKSAGYTYWHSGSKYHIVPKAHKKLDKLVAGIYNTRKPKKKSKKYLSYKNKEKKSK